MFLNLPPVPPALVSVEPVPVVREVLTAAECKRGSRDCFPVDRVGYGAEAMSTLSLASARDDLRRNG
jgi:hypothetical protein